MPSLEHIAGAATPLNEGDRPNTVQFERPPTDAERAEKLRDEIGGLLAQISDKMTEAKRHGLTVAFQIAGPDAFGRFSIAVLDITKKLA